MNFQFQRKRRKNTSPFIGGVILVLIGLGMSFILSRTVLNDAKVSQEWPTTTGTVITSEVKTSQTADGNMFSPHVVYEYEVEGETYTASRLTVADGNSSSARSAENRVDEFPVGSEVTVHYNPRTPSDALLETQAPTILRILYWVGWLLAILGVFTFISGFFRLIRRILLGRW